MSASALEVSIRPDTTPQALSSLLGVAIRMAQRMGIHSEATLAKCTPFEAEMRRRLWWSLILFDTRISELTSSNIATLDPTWDCGIPLNVNDGDLRLDMKTPLVTRKQPTDAVFAVVRSELGDYLRHAAFHLHIDNSALKSLAKRFDENLTLKSDALVKLGDKIEDRYLKLCDEENPTHFMATWTARGSLAKYHLMEHNVRLASSSTQRVEAQYNAATFHALRMLECDTKIMTSHLTKGFAWLHQINFPFPAYYQITQDLRRRPTSEQALHTWDVMSRNWEAWFNVHFGTASPIFQLFNNLILHAWEAYESAAKPAAQVFTVPRIVSSIRDALALGGSSRNAPNLEMEVAALDGGLDADGSLSAMQMPTALLDHTLAFDLGLQGDNTWTPPEMSFVSDIPGRDPMGPPIDHVDWKAFGGPRGW
ncbi:uncharacterized protein A1O9_03277 [Exophiala aquamarina CBS 119918]|uniref:Xylanolytic transcriptional activator regulatory domain-containing protein n=1 Tax=Exophiala aquamarina CBS 119918 TaxID=1182545 RepID=A0A072PQV2_9EURO|nr:uncharacterized protein A1O9_03277 [Exophiala aquamarina CBS 119918]KEF61708.1 hypothetical protein A1O9_03277 [Exophiala aquamarina CBS 119918]